MGFKENLIACTPAILATAALICGAAGTFYCETLEFPTKDSDTILFVGPWSYRTRNYVEVGEDVWVVQTCRSYNYLEKELGFSYEIDSKTRTVMAFSILAVFFGGLGTFGAYLFPCGGAMSDSRWKGIGNIFFFVSVLQGLTLLVQSSSVCLNNPVLQFLDSTDTTVRQSLGDECEWGPGYRLTISSVALWIAAGLSPYVFKYPEINSSEPPQSQTVTYQRNADGTVEEVNVQVVKGTPVEEEQYKEFEKI